MGRRRLTTLLAATLASGMIALPASALSVSDVTDGDTSATTGAITGVVENTTDEVLDEVVPDDESDDVDDLLAPVTDLVSEGEPAPQDDQDDPAPAPSTSPLPGSTRSADDSATAAAPAPDSSFSSVPPASLPGDGSAVPVPVSRTENPPAAQVAPPAPVAAPRLDTAPATRAPELAVPVGQSASDAWLKAIASLMVLGTAGIWHRANRTTT